MSDEKKSATGETDMPKNTQAPTQQQAPTKETSQTYRIRDWASI